MQKPARSAGAIDFEALIRSMILRQTQVVTRFSMI
ncbi:hypothetical protein B0G71_7436 [Paraburkholderia sp. BL27I4N3]|nr:hypothetical protein B0G71_7436 [Paraburkholderia sp. BL27I4N3]